jgi:predicted kinase
MKKINNEIVLVRGLPGSGKSTYAKGLAGYTHLEADMYFEVDGQYVYDKSKINAAHNWCVESAKKALEQGENVVVSNTFIKLWELKKYINLGYPFSIIEMTGTWPNVHGVPAEVVSRMQQAWQKAPSDWDVSTQ